MTKHVKIERHRNGRFKKGSSGNPKGRKKKQPLSPNDFPKLLLKALLTPLKVTQDGKSSTIIAWDLIVKGVVKECLSAKGTEKLKYVTQILKIAQTLPPEPDPPEKDFWGEEQEELFRELEKAQAEYEAANKGSVD